jgi:hypothetical protein
LSLVLLTEMLPTTFRPVVCRSMTIGETLVAVAIAGMSKLTAATHAEI